MFHRCTIGAACVWVLSGAALLSAGCTSARTFATPLDAFNAVAEFAGTQDKEQVDATFGSGASEVLWSGDPVADREDGQRVAEMIRERVDITQQGDEATATVGEAQWPFPIPLKRVKDGWRFDLAAGREEAHNRRIGRNELYTIATLHGYVDAQREYALVPRDGEPTAYAQKLLSMEGLHDGLYWPTAEGEPESPLGPLVADAAAAGYHRSEAGPMPYHGYYYRILTGQGPSAPGGERTYLDSGGRMTGGFAAVAWPATYGNSGVMTFIVNQVGIVFQNDLGRSADATVQPVTLYDPDENWEPVPD
jgi:hypothetical protein